MKWSLIATLFVVFAVAPGSLSAEAPEIEKLMQYFEDMKEKLVVTTQELSEKIQSQELVNQAQTFFQDGQAQLEPLAAHIQEQLKPLATNIEEQLKPLATNMQAQIKPMVENFQTQMEDIIRKLMDQAKAVGN